jgi:streptogramin lyase
MDKDGKSVWVFQRCGTQDYCIGSNDPPLLKFDAAGNLVSKLLVGQVVYPHGLYVDRDGNIWVTDMRTNTHEQGAQSAKRIPGAAPNGATVRKFSPQGKLLLTLGTPGVYGNDATHLSQPSAVVTAPNGDIFVADGHDSAPSNNRIVKYDKTGKFIKAWGQTGSAPGDLSCPHDIAMDSQGRLFVADRTNNRIQIYDQDGKLLDSWTHWGRVSGISIDKNDVMYTADSMSSANQGNRFMRGAHIGDAKTGKITGFVPDPLGNPAPWNPLRGTTGMEGIVVADGAFFVSQVTPPGLAKYTPRPWKTAAD